MTIVYTICTLSYINQTYVLAKSLLQHNPEFKFIIGLLDGNAEDIEGLFSQGVEVVEVEKLQLPELAAMKERYKIYELCFSLKPYYALYLLSKFKSCDKMIYLDSDIYVFNSFDLIVKELDGCSILLSPHSTKPYTKFEETERGILTGGSFNAGFIAIKRTEGSFAFLHWWAKKLIKECIGLVGDQVWLNLVPLYFSGVNIERNIGVNFGHWRLHEVDTININDKEININDTALVFYHYSGFDFYVNKHISNHTLHKRENFKNIEYILDIVSKALIAAETIQGINKLLVAKRYSGLKGKSKFYLKKAILNIPIVKKKFNY